MACDRSTKISPYWLVYGHDAILPWEMTVGSRCVTLQDKLKADDYSNLMKDELEDMASHCLRALIRIEANKARVARWYNKKVKVKEFTRGDWLEIDSSDRH